MTHGLGPDTQPDLVLAELASVKILDVDEQRLDELADDLLERTQSFLAA